MRDAEKSTNYRISRTLASIAPFRSLPEESVAALARACRFVRFEPQETIVGHRQSTSDVYFIVSGSVRLAIRSPNGREIAYGDLKSGDMFGELAAIDGELRAASVVSLTDTVAIAMPQDSFHTAIKAHSSVAEAVLRRLVCRVRLCLQRMYELRNFDVVSRVRVELVRMAEPRVADDDTASISPPPTHAAIANRICARREAVSRELARLARMGLIERDRSSLTIRDFSRLAEMVRALEGAPPQALSPHPSARTPVAEDSGEQSAHRP